MAQSGQRKCLNCAEFFTPDHRNRTRQHYCTQPECRKASKTAAQAAWLAKPANQDYWRDPSHVARVQAYRGEGFKLRTDGHGAVRAKDGLLISTHVRQAANDHMLSMQESTNQLSTPNSLAENDCNGKIAPKEVALRVSDHE